MASFNGGNWGAQIQVAALGSTSATADAPTMLAANDPGAGISGDRVTAKITRPLRSDLGHSAKASGQAPRRPLTRKQQP